MSRDQIRDSIQFRFGLPLDLGGEAQEGADVTALAPLLDRRSCRRYDETPVPEEMVRLLLAAGLSAPTKSDLQQADVVWVREESLRVDLLDGIPGADWIQRAPVFLVVCGNGARLKSLFEGEEFPNDHFDALFNAMPPPWPGSAPARSA